MKRIRFFGILLALLWTLPAPAQELGILWDEANTAYINGDYPTAIVRYDSIGQAGYASYKLYYNLGNAYFKNGEIGRAVLSYNRALRLNPSDADTQYNLAVANSYVKDRIVAVPEFFLHRWATSIRTTLSSNGWAVLSLVLLAIALGCTLLYLLAGKLSFRKTGFYAGIVSLLLFFLTASFAASQRREILNASQAIVMSSAVPVKSSPDDKSPDIFILHEGTKVTMIRNHDNWREIMIADGNKGWIREEALEAID